MMLLQGSISSLEVKPSVGCRAYQPPRDKIPAVDWVALASLRDSVNTIGDVTSVCDTQAPAGFRYKNFRGTSMGTFLAFRRQLISIGSWISVTPAIG
jgi:hypothetical protein